MPLLGAVGSVAETVEIHAKIPDVTVDPAGFVTTLPEQDQSPGVRETDVTLTGEPDVAETAEPATTVEETYSPT